jgi:hypothetical protein
MADSHVTTPPSSSAGSRFTHWLGRPAIAWTLALMLALTQGAFLVHEAWVKSENGNEPLYMNGAAMLWDQGRVERGWRALVPFWAVGFTTWLYDQNWAEGVPMHDGLSTTEDRAGVADQMMHMLWSKPRQQMQMTLLFARLASILATVFAGLLLWRVAFRLSPVAGWVTHLLWTFSPTVLASGYLVMLDSWTANMTVLLLYGVVKLKERRGLLWAALLGVFAGLAIPVKATTLAAVGGSFLALLWIAWSATSEDRNMRWKNLGKFAAAYAGMALFVLWAVMKFRVKPLGGVPLPDFGYYVQGVLDQSSRGAIGGENYLLGRARLHEAVWYFYFVCLAVKMTVGAQLLSILGIASFFRRRAPLRQLWLDAAILAIPVIIFTAMTLGKHQVNMNYLLPAMPLAMLWMGKSFVQIGEKFGKTGTALAVLFLTAGIVESVRLHPHHQMFFNVWAGGPVGGIHYLIVRDDNAQDRRALGLWQQANQIDTVYQIRMDVPGARDSAWGINAKQAPCEPTPGVYALSAHTIFLPGTVYAGCLDWLTVEPPDERINYSILVWKVDEARIARLKAARGKVIPFYASQYIQEESPDLTTFVAEPVGDRVKLTWRFTPQISLVMLYSLDDFDAPDLFDAKDALLGTALGSEGVKEVRKNQRGFYAAVGLHNFIVGIAHVDGKGFLATPKIKGSEKASLFWNVPQGPITLSDETGEVLHRSQELIGMTTDYPQESTTYTLTYGPEGTTLKSRVEVLP